MIRADTIDEMFDVAQCLDLQPLPSGARVGDHHQRRWTGILAADACEAAGLIVQPLERRHSRHARRRLSSNASVGNPVDLVASAGPDAYAHAIVTAMKARPSRQRDCGLHAG